MEFFSRVLLKVAYGLNITFLLPLSYFSIAKAIGLVEKNHTEITKIKLETKSFSIWTTEIGVFWIYVSELLTLINGIQQCSANISDAFESTTDSWKFQKTNLFRVKYSIQTKMGNPFKCFICDTETKKKSTKNISDIKLEHSRKPITEILKKLIGNDDSTIRARNEMNVCILCDDCIDKMNAYDAACLLVKQIEYELKTIISRARRRYESKKNPVKTDVSKKTKSPFSGPPSLEVDKTHFDFDIGPDDGNNADALDTSEPEVVTESEEQEYESDDSFIWPKPRALKRKREKSAENEKKKRRLFKCIECPADYRNINDMQVIIRSNLFVFKCVEFIKMFLLLFWQLHLVSHKNPEFRCGLCNMRLAKGRESHDHEDLHLNRPVLQCIFCNEIFETKYLLAQHVEVHVSVISLPKYFQ